MPGSTTPDGDEVLDAVAAPRAAWTEDQERVAKLQHALRASDHPGLRFELERNEAYAALVGRDEGVGMSMAGWLDEIAEAAKGASA
jgi:hypothetical protein